MPGAACKMVYKIIVISGQLLILLSPKPSMKKIIFICFTVISVIARAQTEPQAYNAAVGKFTAFYNSNKPDSIYKLFGGPMKAALSPDAWKATASQLKSQLGTLQQNTFVSYQAPVAFYTSAFQNASLSMSISLDKDNLIVGLLFKPIVQSDPVADKPFDPSLVESPITQKIASGVIVGTLTTPKDMTGKIPVVLIIAGSGPTDRNGNNLKMDLNTNAYRELAEQLGKNGIASLRYDKRAIGASQTTNKESNLRFDDYVDDAVGWIQILNDDQRFSKIIVIGHSEGSLVGMLACRDQPVKGFISLAGAGERADKILTDQLKTRSQTIQDNFKTLIDSMKRGKTIDNIDPSLWFIARPTIQHYLMSWFRYDPQRFIHLVKAPTLIIQGNTDLQVSTDNAEKLKKGKSDAQLLIIPNMNHILKEAPADRDQNLATYNKPDLPLKAELVPAIVKFINGIN